MRKALIFQQKLIAGLLEELGGDKWRFSYEQDYAGRPISLTMPPSSPVYDFECFPPVFEGLLPEGDQLGAMLRHYKIDRADLFAQLVLAGEDLVGSLTVQEAR